MKDYYEILGIQPNATAGQIKAAYRRLAVRYHPDKNPDPSAEELFKEINEAYDVLSDVSARAQYDWQRNPFNTIVSEMETEAATPRHRDPAYHRKERPPVTPRPGNKKSQRELTIKYLPYFRWACWLALIFGVLFWLDFVLPYTNRTETIKSDSYVKLSRKVPGYQLIVTDMGKKIKNYHNRHYEVEPGDTCTYSQTIFFRTVMRFQHKDRIDEIAVPYSALALFPTVLLIVSLYGFWFRNDAERYFNASVICTLLLPMNIFFIW